MEQNKEDARNELEKIALICDGLQQLFPSGKHAIVFELETKDFKKIQKNFRDVDNIYRRFQIDLSEVECVFIDKNFYIDLEKENKKQEEILRIEKEKNDSKFWNKIKKLFT